MSPNGVPIPESDLLDYIEGQLPAARRVEVAAALRKDPALARLVAGMQDDRRSLSSLPRSAAPAGLMERVEAQLEREALLGLTSGPDALGTLPVSAIVPERASVVGRIWRSSAGRGLAIAAVLAIVGGGVGWAVWSSMGAGGAKPGDRIATNDRGTEETETPDGAPETAIATGSAVEGAELVGPPSALAMATVEVSGESIGPGDGVAGDAAVAAAGSGAESGGDSPRMTPARALELAREGRLAVVVRCSDPMIASKRVERLALLLRDGESARVRPHNSAALPEGLTALASVWMSRPMNDGFIGPPAPTYASDAGARPSLFDTGMPVVVPAAPRGPVSVYTVEIDDAEAMMASLASSLATSGEMGPRVTVEYVRLDEAIDPTPSADPAAVLWWSGPPAQWTWRWRVPVVVETATK